MIRMRSRAPVPDNLREAMNRLARRIDMALPPEHGFALFVFEFSSQDGSPEGPMSYISNAERDAMIKGLREFLSVMERDSN